MKKYLKCLLAVASLGVVVGSVGALSSIRLNNFSFAETQIYSITLSTNDRFTGGNCKTGYTDAGKYPVIFNYDNCSSKTGVHAVLNANGCIYNDDQITSITSIKATFTGELTYKTSLDGTTWSSSKTLTSGVEESISEYPYYVKIESSTGAELSSYNIKYSCVDRDEDATKTATIKWEDMPSAYTSKTQLVVDDITYRINEVACYNEGVIQWKKSSGYLYNKTKLGSISKITLGTTSKTPKTLSLYLGDSEHPSTNKVSIDAGESYTVTEGSYGYFTLARDVSNAAYTGNITIEYTTKAIYPTSLTISDSTASLAPSGTKQLSVSYNPTSCNAGQGVTWSSSNQSVATVDSDGLVTVSSTASIGATATITATSTYNDALTASCVVTVVDQPLDKYTILIYMCGADLESDYDPDYGYAELATGDLKEICSVSKPSDYNIVIETGGCKRWATKYGISSKKLSRYHVENNTLVLDETLTQASMGDSKTLQSFLEYGITNYEAEKMALIYWNHGGALDGVCFDENYDNDSLTALECQAAYQGAWNSTKYEGKFEWVGYDACLMAVQDIAYINKDYFNYMVCSQESEAGEGWDYDNWVDDLYKDVTTPALLTEICDTFIEDNNVDYDGEYSTDYNDQTLSALDLNKMKDYMDAWNSFTTSLSSLISSSTKFNALKTIMNKSLKFGYCVDEEYADCNGGYVFDVFDVKTFLSQLATNSAYSTIKDKVTNLQTALFDVVINASNGKLAAEAGGLCFFFPLCGLYYESSYAGLCNASPTWDTFCKKWGIFND